MADNARRTGPAVEAHQQFLLWLGPTVERFPRSQKCLLGDRIQATDFARASSVERCAMITRAQIGRLRHYPELAHHDRA